MVFNKEEGDDDDEEEKNNGLSNSEEGISSDFLKEILQKLSEKARNHNVPKRLKNLMKRKFK